MATSVILYVLPMMLGQTYDMGKDHPGIQIFNSSTENNSVVIDNSFTDSNYRLVDDSKSIRDLLDVGGKLSLKIKSGMLDASGEGSYLKDSGMSDHAIEILIKVHFETVTHSIPSRWKPAIGWTLQDKKFLGTHYCRSITYGGDLIASVKFTAKDNFEKEKIHGALSVSINAKAVDLDVKGQLDKLVEETQDSTSMEINYYATVPIPGVSYTIDGLLKLVDDFPSHVMKVNNGRGNPLRMELYPLSSLDDTFVTYFENRALKDQLDDMEDQFDDLRRTRKQIGLWLAELPPIVPDAAQQKINEFTDEVEEVFGVYCKSISDLDLSVEASTKPFDDAFAAYKGKDHILPDKYIRKFKLLQRAVYKEAPELKPKNGGASYIHWGSDRCEEQNDTVTSLSGVAIGSETIQDGGSSDFSCSPTNPELEMPGDIFPNYNPKNDKTKHLRISPLRYKGGLKKHSSMYNKMLSCAVCRVSTRTSTIMLKAANKCPDGWLEQYSGLLMAPGLYSAKGEYICVDDDMKESKDVTFGIDDDEAVANVQEVNVHCGSLPCGPYKESVPLSCVVCTR